MLEKHTRPRTNYEKAARCNVQAQQDYVALPWVGKSRGKMRRVIKV